MFCGESNKCTLGHLLCMKIRDLSYRNTRASRTVMDGLNCCSGTLRKQHYITENELEESPEGKGAKYIDPWKRKLPF